MLIFHWMFEENIMVIFSTFWPNQPPKILRSRGPPDSFCDIGCCCFLSRVAFRGFPGYFLMPLAFHPGFLESWRPLLAWSSTISTFGCFFLVAFVTSLSQFIISLIVLRRCLLSSCVFYFAHLPQIFTQL